MKEEKAPRSLTVEIVLTMGVIEVVTEVVTDHLEPILPRHRLVDRLVFLPGLQAQEDEWGPDAGDPLADLEEFAGSVRRGKR